MDQPTPAPGQQTSLVDILLNNPPHDDRLRGTLDAWQLEPHLLQLPLFRGGEQLLDLSATPAQAWPCQDLRWLVRALAMALVTYGYLIQLSDDAPAMFQQKMRNALGLVEVLLTLAQELRQRRALSPRSPTRRKTPSAATLAQGWRHVKEDVETLQAGAYPWFTKQIKRQAGVHLLSSMFNAFRIFGPQDARYSRRALFYAIATILTDREIETGPPEVVGRRLEKRAARAARSPRP